MRHLIPAVLCACLLIVTSCEKDKNERPRRFISMKVDNRVYLAENPKAIMYLPNLTDTDPNNDFLRMEIGAKTAKGDSIKFTLASDKLQFSPGLYPVTKKGNSMTMILNGANPAIVATDKSYGNFSFTITKMESQDIECNFNGILLPVMGTASNRTITDGFFRVTVTQVGQ